MRKIVSAEEGARKKKRNQIILGVLLALIMVLSTLGFALQSGAGDTPSDQISGNEAEYNGFKFVNQNGLWVLGNLVFKYTPQQVPDIGSGSEIKLKANYQGKPAYIYSEEEGAETEIVVNLGQIAQRVQKACPENTTCKEKDLPEKTCNDNFIIIKEGNTNSITQNNNCVFIEGKKEDLAALADQFLFKILEVR